ncbi:MAG: hypothetical protein ABI772_03895 [Bacteroidota bacterium]
MKYLLTLLIVYGINFTAYSQRRGFYDFRLIEVYKNDSLSKEEIKSFVNKHKKVVYTYAEASFSINWYVSKHNYQFSLKNLSKEDITIVWDSVFQVTRGNTRERTFPLVGNYYNGARAFQSSVVAADSVHSNILHLVSKMNWNSGTYEGNFTVSPHWDESPLIPDADNKHELVAINAQYINSIFNIYMPLIINGVQQNFIFSFKVEKYTPLSKAKTYLWYN